MKIDCIIPLANLGDGSFEDRVINLQLLIERFILAQKEVECNIILSEQVIDRSLPTFCSRVKCDAINVIKYHPIFCKPWIFNSGIQYATGDYVVLLEAEVIQINSNYFKSVVEWLQSIKSPWCIGWNKIFYLSRKSRDLYKKLNRLEILKDPEAPHLFKQPKQGGTEGGIVFFEKEFWHNRFYGCDELYKLLGANDNEIAYRAKSITQRYLLYPLSCYHLWHPTSKLKEGEHRETNRRRFLQLVKDSNWKIVQNVLLQYKGKMGGERPLEYQYEL